MGEIMKSPKRVNPGVPERVSICMYIIGVPYPICVSNTALVWCNNTQRSNCPYYYLSGSNSL